MTLAIFDGQTIDVDQTLLALERADCEDSLYTFLKHAWPQVDPSAFTDGWAVEAVAEHLEAVVDGQIRRLIINIPPRMSKSSVCSVALPAWVWAQRYSSATSGPGVRLLHASYAHALALRDSVNCRRVIESAWYQKLWGDRFQLVSDQNTKGRFANSKNGERLITAVEARVTGEGGDLIIIDDPNAANDALSEATIQTTIDWWDTTMSSRLNDPKTGAFIIIQQRVSEADLTGHILSKSTNDYTHLCLPMEYEWRRHTYTSLGWNDPRGCDDDGNPLVLLDTETGERYPRDPAAAGELELREGALLWPERFGERETRLLKAQLGPWATSGQLQQSPSPKGGGIIKDDWWQMWDGKVYPTMSYIVASLDTAYTSKQENDYSALTVWGVFTRDLAESSNIFGEATGYSSKNGSYVNLNEAAGRFDEAVMVKFRQDFGTQDYPKLMLMDAWQDKLELHQLVAKVAATCKKMKVDVLLIENKAAGHSVGQELRRVYSGEGFAVQMVDPKGQDKVARLYSIQNLFAEKLIYAPNKNWAEMVIRQISQFPKGKNDDLVDSAVYGIKHMRDIGVLTRSIEWVSEVEASMRFQGNNANQPLYPA